MKGTLRVYIGYDRREPLAYEVARHSLLEHVPDGSVEVYPVKQQELRELGIWYRPKDRKGSTEFSLTRFLVPYLTDFDGWALFVDCDFIFMGDIMEYIEDMDNDDLPVYVCRHRYTPRQIGTKMDGMKQYVYPKKNWSSCMLFNCSHPLLRVLNKRYVNEVNPSDLHEFKWLPGDDFIGELPLTYNWLAGEPDYSREALEDYIEKNDPPHIWKDGKYYPIAFHYTLGSVLFQAVDPKYASREDYPYMYDYMMEEVNPIFVELAEKVRGKPWKEILEEEREYLKNLKNYDVG